MSRAFYGFNLTQLLDGTGERNMSINLRELKNDDQLLQEIAERLDIETYSEVRPVDYLKQVIGEIADARRIEFYKQGIEKICDN